MEADICEGVADTSTDLRAVDWVWALGRVGGSEATLRELVHIFCDEECPKLIQTVRDALVDEDAVVLTRAAHTLKNSADLFGAKRAFDAAWTLEEFGGESDFQEAARIWKILEKELTNVLAAMAKFQTSIWAANAAD